MTRMLWDIRYYLGKQEQGSGISVWPVLLWFIVGCSGGSVDGCG